MIKESKWNQFGAEGLEVQGIVIHDTNSKLSARDLFNWLDDECTTSQGCHFLIDDKENIPVMPENWKTWSTGKGNDYAFNHCIAVEICDCSDPEARAIAEKRAIRKIKALMKKYNLDKNRLYFHYEFNERTYCPHLLLDKYGTKKNFVEENFK